MIKEEATGLFYWPFSWNQIRLYYALEFDWRAFLSRGESLVSNGNSVFSSYGRIHRPSFNIGHDVLICCKTIFPFCANWHRIFFLFSSQSLGTNFPFALFICNLSDRILCMDPHKMCISSVTSRIDNHLFERTNFANCFCVFLRLRDRFSFSTDSLSSLFPNTTITLL